MRDEGKALNQKLSSDYNAYCGGKPQLDTAVAYAVLVIANNSSDPQKRDQLVDILQGRTTADDKAYKSLAIRRWSPVKKAIQVYLPLVLKENSPDFDTLLDLQRQKLASAPPSWATLMPDKIYALARFWGQLQADEVSKMQTPFGRAVQAAYSYYSGVQINAQPTPSHHVYLHNFERTWARSADCDVLDINSGLHRFGENHLI